MPDTQELTPDLIEEKYKTLSPDKQSDFIRRVIFKVVNDNYGDRISDFNIDDSPKSGSVASGELSTPKLGGNNLVIDWEITDSQVKLTPRNFNVINNSEVVERIFDYTCETSLNSNYISLEYYNFNEVNCVKGWACRRTCISREKKNCHVTLNPEHKTYVGWLQTKIKSGAILHKGHQDEADKLGIKPDEKGGVKAGNIYKKEKDSSSDSKKSNQSSESNSKPKNKASNIKQKNKPAPKKATSLHGAKHFTLPRLTKNQNNKLTQAISEVKQIFKGLTDSQSAKIAQILFPINAPR